MVRRLSPVIMYTSIFIFQLLHRIARRLFHRIRDGNDAEDRFRREAWPFSAILSRWSRFSADVASNPMSAISFRLPR